MIFVFLLVEYATWPEYFCDQVFPSSCYQENEIETWLHSYTQVYHAWLMIKYFKTILLSWIPFRIDAGPLRCVDILVGRDTISIFIFRQRRLWVRIGAQCFILGKVIYDSQWHDC